MHDHGQPVEQEDFRVKFVGPFQHHEVIVNGWRVPLLEAHLEGEDRVMLVLDRRLSISLSADEAERMVPFLADAIAVALGYGSHPGRGADTPLERGPHIRPERVIEIAAAR